MSILSTNTKLIKVGQEYSAGSGISIDDHVISVTGGQEITNVVQSNSATWNEISAVSGSYWPLSSSFTAKNAKVDINGLVNQHLVLNGAYPNIKGFVDGQSYWNWEINSTHVSGHNWEYGASEYNKLNDSHNTLSSNSGTWNDVSSKQDKLTFKYGTTSGSISSINGSAIIDDYTYHMLNVTRVGLTNLTRNVSSNSGTWNDVSTTVQTNSAQWSDSTGDEEVNEFVYNNSATINDVDSVVQSNSAAWGNEFDPSYMSGAIDNKLDESAFSNVSGSFLTAHQSLDGYATENWVTAQGYITGVDLSEYAKTNDVLDDINSAVSGKLDTTSFSTVSGDFLTAVDLTPYYTTAEADTLSSMLSGAIDYVSANAGDEFPASANEAIEAYQTNSGTYLTAHQIIPSAKWEDASDCVQTNSAQWAQGGGSPSGFVSGSNVLFVPNEHSPGQGKVYSANISGDITVKYGDYFNSGENINIYATYSLSSVGSQIGEKLNKSVIEDSKTLSIIDDKAEVYSFAYRPKEIVTTGITTDNYSGPESVNINIRTQDPYKLYSASLVIESDGFNENYIPDGWNFVNSANGSATFTRLYKDQKYDDNINFPGFWDYNLTNASAYSVAYNGFVMDEIAFKSDLTGQGGGVPQSAFDELKASYDALSASYASLSSLFATYSGQWLLPNEGV
jgi:hypothetical protein